MTTSYLVAIDGSPASKNALRYAIELAKDTSADLAAVFVVSPKITFEGGITPPATFTEADQDLLETAEDIETYGQQVLDEAEVIANRSGVELETGLLTGNPDEEIADFAMDNEYDAIFIGHVEIEPDYEELFGSVAKDLIDVLEMPVTVVGA